ncbi:metal ABC transporter metal-binding protein [Bacillus sp. TS-2]|nr:metal ABC transporter metal-binding protein [Bacillus sp. TS-2]
MKKNIVWLALIIGILTLTACGSNDDVEITWPAMFFETMTEEEIKAQAKEQGITDVTVDENGKVIYKVTKSQHKELMDEMEENIQIGIEEIINEDEITTSIKNVTYNKSYSEFTITVDREQFENSFEAFAILPIGMIGVYYQVFDGQEGENLKVTVNLEDEASGEIFSEMVFPDDLDL